MIKKSSQSKNLHDKQPNFLIYTGNDGNVNVMGLTNWKHAPEGKILKSDVSIAKNYLSEAHIKELNQIVSAYLDLAENRAQRQVLMKMAESHL